MADRWPLSVRLCLAYNRLFGFRLRRQSYSGWHAPLFDIESQLRYSEWRQSATADSVAHLQPIDLKDRVVLDFGVGRGGPAVWMAEQGAKRVIGVDIDDFFLNVSEKYVERVDPKRDMPIEIAKCEPTRSTRFVSRSANARVRCSTETRSENRRSRSTRSCPSLR